MHGVQAARLSARFTLLVVLAASGCTKSPLVREYDGASSKPAHSKSDAGVSTRSTDAEVARPSTDAEVASPSTDAEVAPPSTDAEAASPSTDAEAASPGTDAEVPPPSIDAEVTPHSTDAEVSSPVTLNAPVADVAMHVPDASVVTLPQCADTPPNQLPSDLVCTGLYTDLKTKQLSAGIRMFLPAQQLWSDGATKTRWIYLPEGTQIDTSDPDEWRFPVGTKLWKEFQWNGHRVETRLFWKITDGRWLRTTYRWNDDETQAERFGGGAVQVGGQAYYIPNATECDQCHKGRLDSVLGFEAILLGVPGVLGLSLAELIATNRLTEPDHYAKLALGDDGTGQAMAVLPWLHVNCGISCHNANSVADAYSTGLRLRLSIRELDGAPTDGVAIRTTALGVPAKAPRWSDWLRIQPGSAADSLLYMLMSTRDPDSPRDRMPPIASNVVPQDAARLLAAWINAMPHADDSDAGAEAP